LRFPFACLANKRRTLVRTPVNVNWPFGSWQSRAEAKSTVMREQILRQFFEGKSSATELAGDVAGSTRQSTSTVSITSVEDMDGDFRVTSDMGVRLCDAVLSGDLPAESLRTIGFALEASDTDFIGMGMKMRCSLP
jgi:hypothetical protein